MTIKDRYFPTQVKGEKIFLLVRRHWIIFFFIAFFIVVLIIPVIVLLFYWLFSPEIFSGPLGNYTIVITGIYTLIVLGLSLYGFVNYYLDVYIVTNERLVDIKQNGFFRREIAELHLRQVQDVEARVEGFLNTLFHFGSVYIQTAGERENFVFEDVPHPYTLAKKIINLHKAQIDFDRTRPRPQPPKESYKNGIDDYRPEDYSDKKDEEPETKETNYSYKPDSNPETPPEEDGFGAHQPEQQEKIKDELRELSEGEEVSFNKDDKDY